MQHLSLVEKIQSLAVLVISFFALGFVFIAPLELFQVYRAENWTAVPAQLVSARIERVRTKAETDVLYYEFVDLETGQKVRLVKARPGDFFLFSGVLRTSGWTSLRSEAERYHGVSNLTVYRSPEKERYYLEKGSYGLMLGVWALSLSWWIGLLGMARSKRRPSSSSVEPGDSGKPL